MPDLATLIQSGTAHVWLYLPAAMLLGALHALEPGHSKSLMAAFIIAIRGTPAQAVLLGVSAAVGHTLIVWGLAIAGLYLGDKLILDKAEPWLVLVSGVLVIALALRLLWGVYRQGHRHEHAHDHDHACDHHRHEHMSADEHAAAHEREIAERFANRSHVGTWEIAWFGFTGGLLPCPAAIAVLLVCLQIKAFSLGIAMVAAFSIGLAMTLVSVGLVAAWGVRRAASGWSGFSVWADRLPYISGALVLMLGLFITTRALWALGLIHL